MQKRLLTCFLALFVCAGSVVYPMEGNVRVRAQEKYGADLEIETLERADSNTQVLYQEWEYCILEDGTAELTGYTGGEEIVSIPAKVVGADGSEVAVTQMGSVFSGNEIVKEAVIPEGIKTLGGYAFSGCSNLERVTLPDSLLRISREGFKNCAKLNGITLPGSLTYIGIQAFEGCSSLTDIVFPESLIRIEEGAFSSCNNIKHIEIPQSVESLHGSFGTAFSSKNLESIHVSEENPNYSSEDGILYDKNKTTLIKCPEQKSEVMIPQSIVAIHDSAFSGCKKLQKIDLPSALKQIDSWVFSGCNNLQGMILPDGITDVQYHAFDGCTSMKFIAIPNSVTFIDNRAFANGFDAEYNERYLDVVIVCMKDSDAESYAKEYGFRYKIVDSFDGLVVGEYEEEVPGGDENKNPPVTEDKNPTESTEEQDQEKEKNLTLDKSAIQFDTIGASQTLTAIVTPA
ncbi:MAG: leucine-rich repeat domain-containing protein, partial [Lachnospiraceae bacterium]|nr:leucine-rich repeat domain-containing protein [Lachnospiraceae bacterium]